MTGFDYGRAQATAERLIKRYGQDGKLRAFATSGPAYNPTREPVDHDAQFAVLSYDSRLVDGTRILVTDKLVYLSAKGLALVPVSAHVLVEADGTPLKVVNVKPLSPAGVAVYYEIQARY